MLRQTAYFSHTSLQKPITLAGETKRSERERRGMEDAEALGGMRRPDISVASSNSYAHFGHQLYNMLERFVEARPEALEIVEKLRTKVATDGFSPALMRDLRSHWMATLGSSEAREGTGPDAAVLQAWGVACRDADARQVLPNWLRHGAPLGIEQAIESTGVFPPAKDADDYMLPQDLHTQLEGWSNYKSAEEEPEVVGQLLREQEDKQHCRMFDTLEEALEYLHTDSAVLSKLALVTKVRADGSKKYRLIWDLLRSQVNRAVRMPERIILPRLQDAVEDALGLLQHDGQLEWAVLDVADAFHNIPIDPSERKYACGSFNGKYIVFAVLCMGGKSSPGIWGRFAAAIGRVIASIFAHVPLRCEIYVDDRLLVVGGNVQQRTKHLAMALLALSVLGFPLAWGKGVVGSNVSWIGAQVQQVGRTVRITIPEDKLRDIMEQAARILSKAVVSKRALRSFCGSVAFVAGMLPELRPFLSMLWKVLSSKSSGSSLPEGLAHTKQCRIAINWLQALFSQVHGPLQRDFSSEQQVGSEGDYIITDACPWGMAGVRYANYTPIAWYATRLTAHDLRRFSASLGDSSHNTTWEALALLIAVRIWNQGLAVLVRVKSDSLSALRSLVRMSSPSPALNAIARELALDSVVGLYKVGFAAHVPGISNILADDLSRMWAPEPHPFPTELEHVPQDTAPPRDMHFWKAWTTQSRGGARRPKERQSGQSSR